MHIFHKWSNWVDCGTVGALFSKQWRRCEKCSLVRTRYMDSNA